MGKTIKQRLLNNSYLSLRALCSAHSEPVEESEYSEKSRGAQGKLRVAIQG